jgi:hypothetical protein
VARVVMQQAANLVTAIVTGYGTRAKVPNALSRSDEGPWLGGLRAPILR